MVATTDQKARMFDLTAGVMELVRDGNRNIGEVCDVLQIIKEDVNFAPRLLGQATKPAPKPSLLKLIDTVTIPATAEFVARDKFVRGIGDPATVQISYVGDNFTTWFVPKIERSVAAETSLRYAKLTASTVDAPIRAVIGSEFEETTLAQIYTLIERQKNGEKGVFLNNGYANIFYVKDVNGVLRAVDVRWSVSGWHVDAYSVTDPNEWFDGYQVFSRNSSVAVAV